MPGLASPDIRVGPKREKPVVPRMETKHIGQRLNDLLQRVKEKTKKDTLNPDPDAGLKEIATFPTPEPVNATTQLLDSSQATVSKEQTPTASATIPEAVLDSADGIAKVDQVVQVPVSSDQPQLPEQGSSGQKPDTIEQIYEAVIPEGSQKGVSVEGGVPSGSETSDRLITLNQMFLQKIADRMQGDPLKYTPSHVARIISRSIPEKNQRTARNMKGMMQRGHIGKLPTSKGEKASLRVFGNETAFQYHQYKINYDTIVFPGTHYGEEIFDALDEKVRSFSQPADLNTLLRIAAFQTVVAASTHAFPDSNGRVSVGLADVYLRAHAKRSLNMELLSGDQKAVELWETMVPPTYLLLPGNYNPKAVIEELERNKKFKPSLSAPKLPFFVFQEQAHLNQFRPQFAESIIRFIHDFQPEAPATNDQLDIYYHIDKLAHLYRASLKEAV